MIKKELKSLTKLDYLGKKMRIEHSLCNQLLIAMPGMADSNFNNSVTLICEHNTEGALGIVINRPIKMRLGELFQQLNIDSINQNILEEQIFNGGPVAQEQGFVIHDPSKMFANTLNVSEEIQLTLSKDIINSLATGDGPKNTLIALGYAGWAAGQLESEILSNTWLTVPATPEIIFEIPFSKRWHYAANIIGIDLSLLTKNAGHA